MTEGKEIIPAKKNQKKSKKDSIEEITIPDEIIEKVGSREEALKLILSRTESFSGPIPHPKIFAQYKEVMPDAPKRIFKMAELQQKHRFEMESSVINGDVKRADLGLWFGFVLYSILWLSGVALLFVGKDLQGYSLLVGGFIGGIVNFIRVGREREKQIQPPPKKSSTNKRKKKKNSN